MGEGGLPFPLTQPSLFDIHALPSPRKRGEGTITCAARCASLYIPRFVTQ